MPVFIHNKGIHTILYFVYTYKLYLSLELKVKRKTYSEKIPELNNQVRNFILLSLQIHF
jgi:hypothetical protein